VSTLLATVLIQFYVSGNDSRRRAAVIMPHTLCTAAIISRVRR